MERPAVQPTLVIVGLNRSGTTALAQSLLNHPEVELFKDPGKFAYESTGTVDHSHFFCPPLTPSSKARVIKQSIGQYTAELCTIPIYPMGSERPLFLRQLHHLYLIRHPRLVWNDWQSMTTWLQQTKDPTVIQSWEEKIRDKGIPVGWGSIGLFRLAYIYFWETFKFVSSVTPRSTYVVCHEDLLNKEQATLILSRLCEKLGLPYVASMLDWKIQFGQDVGERMVDGFNRPLVHPERQKIHQIIRGSSGLGSIVQPILDTLPPWPDAAIGDELEDIHAKMKQGSHELLRV
jgi:hypothetical protein